MGSGCRFRLVKLSVYGQERKCENASVEAKQPVRFRLDENRALMSTRLDNVLGFSTVFGAPQCPVPWLLTTRGHPTSFSGSCMSPPLWGGEIKDRGNEVGGHHLVQNGIFHRLNVNK